MPKNRDDKLVTLFNSCAVCQHCWSPADVLSCRCHQVKVNKSELGFQKLYVLQQLSNTDGFFHSFIFFTQLILRVRVTGVNWRLSQQSMGEGRVQPR